jgi:hypothetical protein
MVLSFLKRFLLCYMKYELFYLLLLNNLQILKMVTETLLVCISLLYHWKVFSSVHLSLNAEKIRQNFVVIATAFGKFLRRVTESL